MITPNLSELDIIIAGQLFTGRIEVLENYLRERVHTLLVVGIIGAYTPGNPRCSLYDRGRCVKTFFTAGIHIKQPLWYKKLLLVPIYVISFISTFYSVLQLRKKFHIFVGIGIFPAFVGILLKRLRIADHLIYYSIDYFPLPFKFGFDMIFAKVSMAIDEMCVKASDIVWDISPRITEARKKFSGLGPEHYRHIVVPLGFSSNLLRYTPFEEIERERQ